MPEPPDDANDEVGSNNAAVLALIAPRPTIPPSYLYQEAKGKVLTNLQSFRINGSPTNEDARDESEAIFASEAGKSFDTPKPEALLERIIAAAKQPGDTVLEPFAGSGTPWLSPRKWAGTSWELS